MRAPRLPSDRWQPISRYSVAPSLGAGMRRRLSIDAAHSCRKSPRGALRPISGAEPRSAKRVRDAHERIKSFSITPPRFAAFRDHRLPSEQSILQDENAKFEPPSESDYTPNGYQAKRFVEHGQRAKRELCVDAQAPCDAVVKAGKKAGNREAEVKKNGAGLVARGSPSCGGERRMDPSRMQRARRKYAGAARAVRRGARTSCGGTQQPVPRHRGY